MLEPAEVVAENRRFEAVSSTVFEFINRATLNNIEVIIPSRTELDKFEELYPLPPPKSLIEA